jgi:hypothetical protein
LTFAHFSPLDVLLVIQGIESCPAIMSLDMSHNKCKRLDGLEYLPNLTSLRLDKRIFYVVRISIVLLQPCLKRVGHCQSPLKRSAPATPRPLKQHARVASYAMSKLWSGFDAH